MKSLLQTLIKNEQYLDIPYEEKDEAKKLGAKWDPKKRSWYAPNMEKILFDKWKKQEVTLLNEDRSFGGNDLFIDLIPKTCWFTNVRFCIESKDWVRVRRYISERANFKCECCSIEEKKSTSSLEAHERWDYDEKTQTQKLIRIVALCKDCHRSTHIGFASINGEYDKAKEHLKKVRNFSEEEFRQHETKAFRLWRERNKINWNLDLSLITLNNLKLKEKLPDKNERKEISKEELQVKRLENFQKINSNDIMKNHSKKYPSKYNIENFIK